SSIPKGKPETPTKRLMETAPKAPRREAPTRQSLEAVKLAQEESRIAQTLAFEAAVVNADWTREEPSHSMRDEPSRGSGGLAPVRELYAPGEADAEIALAVAVASDLQGKEPEPFFEPEPFDEAFSDGLRRVDDAANFDPFGGLVPVDDDPDA